MTPLVISVLVVAVPPGRAAVAALCIFAPYARVIALADNAPANLNHMMYEHLIVCCTKTHQMNLTRMTYENKIKTL